MERSPERRLAAVLAADVIGFSRLMEHDEAGTLSRLKNLRSDLIDPKIAEYRGRIVKLIGDGVLVEFPSVINALTCAVEIQRSMAQREQDLPNDMRIALRVGINIGDIIVDENDIYGTGVNVATRLEGLAEPGGICVSGRVVQQVETQVDIAFESLGPQQVKNIEQPVNAYKVVLDGARKTKAAAAATTVPRKTLRIGRWLVAFGLVCLVTGAAAGIWYRTISFDFEPASTSRMAYPLPKVPSVAVLPFKNIAGNSDHEYFADAMTEDIVTDLSKVSGIFVVASKSSLSYKGAGKDLGKVAEELGVRYLLDGSVQRSQNQLRITVRLIDAISRKNIWGERYDREMKDLLSVQSEIAQRIAKALAVTLTANDIERLFQKRTGSIEAYDTFLNARRTVDSPSEANIEKGLQLFRRVIELDPNFAGGYAGLSYLYNIKARFGYGRDRAEYRAKALEFANKAIETDSNFAWSYIALGGARLANGDPIGAVDAARKALILEPNGYFANLYLGFYLQFAGQGALAVEHVERAKRLSPLDTVRNLAFLGRAYFINGNYKKSAEIWERRYRNLPLSSANGFVYMAATYSLLGEHEKAAATANRLRETFPKFRLSKWGYIKHAYAVTSGKAR